MESKKNKNIDYKKNCISCKPYYVYMLRCENDILYTGITTDVKRRFYEHKKVNGSKKGAKFTKSHKPEKIEMVWKTNSKSDALKLEIRIKSLDKNDKELLIKNNKYFKIFFNDILDISRYSKMRRIVI